MLKLINLLLSLYLAGSCALLNSVGLSSSQKKGRIKGPQSEAKDVPQVAPIAQGKSGAVWHLVSPQEIIVSLSQFDKKERRNIKLTTGISKRILTSGDWQLRGLKYKGTYFSAINDAQKIVIKLKDEKYLYVGSLIFSCPKVSEEFMESMKRMKYFNRFYLKSKKRICELVIGNDFEYVKNELLDEDKDLKNAIILGL